MVDYVDRLPDVVRSVDFTTADGQTNRVPTTADGFVLFTYTGEVPDGYSKTDVSVRRPWLTRITYLDHDGRPLAAANTGSSELEEMRVGDLPLLTAYPSRRGTLES